MQTMLALLFQIGNETYALEAQDVRQVIPALPVRPIPGAAAGVLGTFHFNGESMPAIDITLMAVGRASRDVLSSRFIIVNYPLKAGGSRPLALLAESATEAMEFSSDAWQDTGISVPDRPFLGPVAQVGNRSIQKVEIGELISASVEAVLFLGEAS